MTRESKEQRYWRRMRESRMRLCLLGLGMLVMFAVMSFRLVAIPFKEPKLDSDRQVSAYSDLFQARADILERNGALLASDLQVSSLNADVPLMRKAGVDLEDAARRLAQSLPQLDEQQLLARLEKGGRFPILQRILPTEAFAVRSLGIPGIHLISRPTRLYPHGDLFAHAVGFVNVDNVGQSGVELSQNSRLQRDQRPIVLTIDELLQHILRKALQEAYEKFEARAACGVILDATNAEILALVSLPSFDPHLPAKITHNQYFNCVVQGNYELGSIFKILTMAMALESGVASFDSIFDVREPIVFSNKKISDIKQSERALSLEEVFVHSSNIGAAMISRDLGAERQQGFLKDFAMLDALPVAFEGKSKPLLSHGSAELRAMTIGFGHGIAVSPLHLASAVAGLVSDGVVRAPSIIKGAYRDEEKPARVISHKTVRDLRRLLFANIQKGTGARAAVDGYALGGKTGTAEKPTRTDEGVRYSQDKVVSSFVGVLPIDAPRYVIFTMLDEPLAQSGDLAAINASRVMVSAVASIFRDLIVARGVRRSVLESDDFQAALGMIEEPVKAAAKISNAEESGTDGSVAGESVVGESVPDDSASRARVAR